jgi:hypothetical protein
MPPSHPDRHQQGEDGIDLDEQYKITNRIATSCLFFQDIPICLYISLSYSTATSPMATTRVHRGTVILEHPTQQEEVWEERFD